MLIYRLIKNYIHLYTDTYKHIDVACWLTLTRKEMENEKKIAKYKLKTRMFCCLFVGEIKTKT